MEIVAPYLLIPFGVLLILGIPVAFALGLACMIFLFFSGTTIGFNPAQRTDGGGKTARKPPSGHLGRPGRDPH